MAPKILDMHHLKMGTVLVLNDGEEKINLKVYILIYCFFFEVALLIGK